GRGGVVCRRPGRPGGDGRGTIGDRGLPAGAGLGLRQAKLGPRGSAALWAGKLTALMSRALHVGGGTTLPGDVSRWVDRRILTKLAAGLDGGRIVVSGTDGKPP